MSSRKKRSPEEQARREKIRELLQSGGVSSMEDIQNLFKETKEWQQRPLEAIYAVVFLDAIHYHVRSEGQIMKKAVYIAIGIDLDGKRMCWVCGLERMKAPSSG